MSPTSQSTLIEFIPDDLLLSCFARVSRLYYPTLSLVSKRFRSLLASPELYKVRSLLNNTESCLYVCLWANGGYRLYTLCRKPDQTLTNDISKKKNKTSSGNVLALVPIPRPAPGNFSSLVVVGYNIYNIAGFRSINDVASSSLSILDCRSHTWRKAPSLRLELLSLSASVLDQKIYVAGRGCGGGDSVKNSFEVFDTKTQTWDPEPIPCSDETCNFFNSRTISIDGNFYVTTEKEMVAYNSKEGRWDVVGLSTFNFMDSDIYCVIENVLYSVYDGEIRWYDTKVTKWRGLKGLEELPKFTRVRLDDSGGKMAVLWEREERVDFGSRGGSYEVKIWCAEITLKRRPHEIRGKVEWFDHVLTVSTLCELVKVLAVTV